MTTVVFDVGHPNGPAWGIFRQEKFVGWSFGHSAESALDLWITTPRSDGTDLRKMPGPWSAVEEGEARERGTGLFTVTYNNDVGPRDEGFWEWWEVSGAAANAKFDCESDAQWYAAARPALPDLLAENERLTAELAHMTEHSVSLTADWYAAAAENERLTNSLAQANKDFAAVFAKLVVADGHEAEKHELTAAQHALINRARQAFDRPQVEEQTKQIDLAAFDRMMAENERLREVLKPFANYADNYIPTHMTDVSDDHIFVKLEARRVTTLTIGNLRRTAEALAGTHTPTEKPENTK